MTRLVVHTARVDYAGPDRLDVTRKGADEHAKRHGGDAGAGAPFAPSWRILGQALQAKKEGRLEAHWSVYREAYAAEMRESFAWQRGAWLALLRRGEVTLTCYCVDPERCHRTLLAGLLARAGAAHGVEVVLAGERALAGAGGRS